MRIGQTNSLNTFNSLQKNQSLLQKSIEKLSSGFRINKASDDAAGLSISEKMRAQIRGLSQSSRNIQDAISLIQTAEGGLNEVHSLLQRGRELSVQGSNGTLSSDDKGAIQQEMFQLLQEVDNISENTTFNNRHLLRSTGDIIPVPTVPDSTPTPVEPPPVEPDPVTPPETPPVAITDEEKIIQALQSQYLEQSEKMIEKYYGLKADNTNLTVVLEDANNAMIAYVSYYVGGDGKGFNVELHLDKEDFLPATGFNTGKNAPIYNDRIIAHEMTHAVMARTMNYGALPKWFKEGTAEFIQGADERLNADIYYNGKANVINAIGNGTDSTWSNTSLKYSSGYVAVRYLHERIKDAGGEGMKDLMTYLSENQSATLDQALKNIPLGSYSGGLTEFVTDYKANGQAFLNGFNLSNSDTGAIGGLDADGGAIKNAENVVADISNWQEQPLEGFNVIWEESNPFTPFSSMNEMIDAVAALTVSADNPLSIQVGPNSNSSVKLFTSNITLEKLGLDNVDISIDSVDIIDKFDKAINLISSERSRYGAMQNRFEYSLSVTSITKENLTNAESRIRDVDMANEVLNKTKLQILLQASQSIFAQSNSQASSVLQLLS